jgi:alkylation response protein AidB-like acyl-CoA dehydrogenase
MLGLKRRQNQPFRLSDVTTVTASGSSQLRRRRAVKVRTRPADSRGGTAMKARNDGGRTVLAANFFLADRNLRLLLERLDPAMAGRWQPALSDFGAWVACEVDAASSYTHRHGPPVLESHDRDGRLVNRIRHNPAWDRVSNDVYRRGAVALNYGPDPAPFVVTFAMGYLLSQASVSLHCPVTMSAAVAHVLARFAPAELRERFLPQLLRTDGQALSGGTWATELHGGSDIGGTTTVALPAGSYHRLTGLKWFVSNADGGLAIATARPEGALAGTRGLGLYLVPLRLDDGSANGLRFRRLKDKLGTIGVPTAEVELEDATAYEIAPPPDGFRLMMEALGISRIHNAVAAAGVQRRAFAEALAYAGGRRAFGDVLTGFPMVQDELLRMMVQAEAGAALGFEAARAFDAVNAAGVHAVDDADDPRRAWLRLATALAKYQTAEEAIAAARSAIEILGGNGYTYDHVTPRLLCDAQVLTVWEGPANVQALEVLRMLGNRYPGYAAFVARIEQAVGAAPGPLAPIAGAVSAALADCRAAVELLQRDVAEARRHARRLLALMADLLAAALLLEEAAADLARGDGRKALVARLFVEGRLMAQPRCGILPGRDWTERRFADLVGYREVALAAGELG